MIPILIPDMPTTEELLPWLAAIEQRRVYSNDGPLLAQLQAALLAFIQPRASAPLGLVSMPSGTAALELSLHALSLPPQARVAVPSFTFVGTALAIVNAGLQPVFVDVDPLSWLLTPDLAREAFAAYPDLAAILPVAALGCPQDAAAWDVFAAETGLPIVIDAAGAIADQTVGEKMAIAFSLHATKAISTGEGGFVVSSNFEWLSLLRRYSRFGLEAGWAVNPGGNHKLSEYAAAVGLASLQRWPQKQAKLQTLYACYRRMLAPLEGIQLQALPDVATSTIFCVCLPETKTAHAAIAYLAEHQILSKQWYLPALHLHPLFAHYPTVGDLKQTLRLHQCLLGLPFFTDLSLSDAERVCATLAAYLSSQ